MNARSANRQVPDPRTESQDQGTLVAGDGAQADKRKKKDLIPANESGRDGQPDRRGEDAGDDSVQSSGPVAGGDKSDRAARSGATGERNPEGAANKPEPKDQDEKGMGVRRNR